MDVTHQMGHLILTGPGWVNRAARIHVTQVKTLAEHVDVIGVDQRGPRELGLYASKKEKNFSYFGSLIFRGWFGPGRLVWFGPLIFSLVWHGMGKFEAHAPRGSRGDRGRLRTRTWVLPPSLRIGAPMCQMQTPSLTCPAIGNAKCIWADSASNTCVPFYVCF